MMTALDLETTLLGDGQWDALDSFVASQPLPSLITFTREWSALLTAFLQADPLCLVARKGGAIVGAIPLMVRSVPGWGTVVNSLPFQGGFGGTLVDVRLPPDQRQNVEFVLLRSCVEWVLQNQVDSLTLTPHPWLDTAPTLYSQLLPESWQYYRLDKITQFSNLEYYSCSLSCRYNHRKALRDGVVIQELNHPGDPDYLEGAHIRMPGVGAKPRPPHYYDLLAKHLEPGKGCRVWVAYHGNMPVGGLLGLYAHQSAEVSECWSSPEGRKLRAMDALMGTFIQSARETGYKWIGFGGSPTEGIQAFKAGWGGQPRRFLYHHYCKALPERWKTAGPAELQRQFPWFFVAPYHLWDTERM